MLRLDPGYRSKLDLSGQLISLLLVVLKIGKVRTLSSLTVSDESKRRSECVSGDVTKMLIRGMLASERCTRPRE